MSRLRVWSMTGTCIAALVGTSPVLAQTVPDEQRAQAANAATPAPNNAPGPETAAMNPIRIVAASAPWTAGKRIVQPAAPAAATPFKRPRREGRPAATVAPIFCSLSDIAFLP